MKLSFSTLSFDEYDFPGLIEVCKQNGYHGIEIRMGTGVGNAAYTAEQLSLYKSMLDDASIAVTNLGSSVCIRGNNTEQLDEFTSLLPMAKTLGARGIRIFMGNFRRFTYNDTAPIDYSGCVEWIQQACDTAAGYGVAVYIETHNEFASGRELRKLLDLVKRDNCKIIWDIMHPLEENETPAQTMSYIGRDIAHVHVKDGTEKTDPQSLEYIYCPIGEGVLPIAEIVSLLQHIGYDGYFSLEWEEAWRDSLNTIALPHYEVLRDYAQFMKDIEKSQR